MRSYKTWTWSVLGTVSLLVGCVVAVNVTVDAYGIFRSDFSRQFQVPNLNFIKIKYLLRHRDRYDSFIFGSSRVENIDQSKIRNGSYYNMTYPLGLPAEHLGNIRLLLASGFTVKNVLIGIDEFSFQVDPVKRREDLLAQPHPAVSGKPWALFLGEYFFKLRGTSEQLRSYIRHNYTRRDDPEEKRTLYDVYGSGRIFCRDCDEEIERNRETHAANLAKTPPNLVFEGDHVDDALQALKEIAELCRKNGTNLVIFVNPLYQSQYLTVDLAGAARFKKGLASITSYYDFSGINTITTDGYYYYEHVHYRPLVGDMILRVLFSTPGVQVPNDFGRYVTQANVDEHLREQCEEIRNLRQKIALTSRNAAYADSCAEGLTSSSRKGAAAVSR